MMKATLPSFQIKLKRKRRTPPGASPGSLNIEADAKKPQVSVYSYDSNQLDVREVNTVDEINQLLKKQPSLTHWINIKGFGDKLLIDDQYALPF